MKSRIRLAGEAAALIAFCVPAIAIPRGEPGPLPELTSGESTPKWVVDRADNICGLDDARMLSKPAKVDYEALLSATPEMKKMKDDKVDPNSSEGIQLRQKAVDRIRTAADKVRQAEGHCSVWKDVRHTDGRVIADITTLVKAQL